METRLLKSREILKHFLERWPLEAVRKMTLGEYVDVSNPDTFCQWVETQTRPLGSIKGHFSNKFGIYKKKNSNDISIKLISDGTYNWMPFLGVTKDQAFQNVKNRIIEIIEAAQAGNFDRIDGIRLNHLFKWKIAVLYSNEQLVPVFKKEVIWEIAFQQGLKDPKKIPFSKILIYITKNKPANQNIYQYATDIYREFGKEDEDEISYYIIGSKYGENANEDMFPLMEEFNVVSTGFAWEYDLSHLYRKEGKEIISELKEKGEPSRSYKTLDKFLQLKPGDIVAIKSTGSPKAGGPYLEIIAYAVVVEREGLVYWHEPENFGHCINVEFIKLGIKNQFDLGGYGRTIHHIDDDSIIDIIFEGYKTADSTNTKQKIKNRRKTRKAASFLNTKGQKRKGTQGYVTKPKHNQIQQLFKEHLESLYGAENVFLEENFVDIKLIQPNSITLYEVKPYDLAEDCIVAGIGQLLSYTFSHNDNRINKLRIVGPCSPDDEEKKFIKYLQTTLNIDFNYEYFEVE